MRDRVQQENNVATINNNLKTLDENEICLKLINSMFKHEVNSIDALLMRRKLNNVQGLNKEIDLFQTENKNNTKEMKDENEDTPTSNGKNNIKKIL